MATFGIGSCVIGANELGVTAIGTADMCTLCVCMSVCQCVISSQH